MKKQIIQTGIFFLILTGGNALAQSTDQSATPGTAKAKSKTSSSASSSSGTAASASSGQAATAAGSASGVKSGNGPAGSSSGTGSSLGDGGQKAANLKNKPANQNSSNVPNSHGENIKRSDKVLKGSGSGAHNRKNNTGVTGNHGNQATESSDGGLKGKKD